MKSASTKTAVNRLKAGYAVFRSRWINKLVSLMYGQPMQVLPKGHAGLAGAVVVWYMQDGFKQFVMVRNPDMADDRMRFVSCLGVSGHATLPLALKAVMEAQLGKVFVKTLGESLLATDRVGAAPVFTLTDESTGIASPIQALVWVVQVQPAQVELIEAGGGAQVLNVPDFAMSSAKVSPTHRALWQAVQRHLPKGQLKDAVVLDEQAAEDAIKDVGVPLDGTPRIIH